VTTYKLQLEPLPFAVPAKFTVSPLTGFVALLIRSCWQTV